MPIRNIPETPNIPATDPNCCRDRAFARLDAGKTLVDIRDEAEPPHLAVGDYVDTAFGLLVHGLGNCVFDSPCIGLGVKRLAPFLGLDH